jgi:hypothetical protein
VSPGHANTKITVAGESAFETHDFYLACFLRCTGYALLDLRDEAQGFHFSGPPDAAR